MLLSCFSMILLARSLVIYCMFSYISTLGFILLQFAKFCSAHTHIPHSHHIPTSHTQMTHPVYVELQLLPHFCLLPTIYISAVSNVRVLVSNLLIPIPHFSWSFCRMAIELKEIDEPRLYTDLGYRFQYLSDFIGISEADVGLIHGTLYSFKLGTW